MLTHLQEKWSHPGGALCIELWSAGSYLWVMPCLPSPSHHHFYRWYKLTIPRKMGCKNGIVLPTIGFGLRFFCQSYASMMTHLVGGGWLHDKHVGCWPHAGSGIGGFEYLWLQKMWWLVLVGMLFFLNQRIRPSMHDSHIFHIYFVIMYVYIYICIHTYIYIYTLHTYDVHFWNHDPQWLTWLRWVEITDQHRDQSDWAPLTSIAGNM